MHVLAHALDQFDFGPPQTFANLTMIPLLHRAGQEATYVTLDEALATGHFCVTEVSDGGHVPELHVLNDLGTPLLLLDGEELVGAKQNRVVNLTILVPAHASLTIPVSCVEALRWHHVSDVFAGSGRAQFAEGRARKAQQVSRSLAMGDAACADQGDVWERISQRVALSGVDAPTSAMADVFESGGATSRTTGPPCGRWWGRRAPHSPSAGSWRAWSGSTRPPRSTNCSPKS